MKFARMNGLEDNKIRKQKEQKNCKKEYKRE